MSEEYSALKYEPAGHSFHSAALRLAGYCEEEDSNGANGEKSPNNKESSYMQSSESYSTKGKKKSGAGEQDHYALLGLGHLRYLATVDEIENHFKAVQEAYEVLMDPVRRRIYDSTDEFDDEIPTECAPHDFFKVFGPAFMRNGRWSFAKPIPSLGDNTTPLKEVDIFYNFWYSFKSWREFPHADDEFDLEQAESRDHKRWMERQNAKLSEKARKEEYVRIRSLVDNAYKSDPRILRRKEVEKAKKQKKKEAKYLVKKLQEEEAARDAEEEKRKTEEEDKRAAEASLQQKKVKEKEKKLLRKERTRLRTLSAPVLSLRLVDLSEDDVETICLSLDIDQLQSLCDNIEGEKEGLVQTELLKEALGKSEGKKLEDMNMKTTRVRNGSTTAPKIHHHAKKEKPWGREEIELLRKGIQKYPKGTSRRWEVISEYIGTGRSVEEILKATKTVLQTKPDSAKAIDSFLEKRKPTSSIASPLTTREEIQGTSVNNDANNNTNSTNTATDDSNSKGSSSSQSEKVENSSDGVSDQDVWTTVQERELVEALKTFPKNTDQRWGRVAAAVPGKSVNNCKKKFALLKESFRNKKSEA